jgi:hypothetical protein
MLDNIVFKGKTKSSKCYITMNDNSEKIIILLRKQKKRAKEDDINIIAYEKTR